MSNEEIADALFIDEDELAEAVQVWQSSINKESTDER